MTVYRAQVTREDGWWMVHVPAIDALTQARRFAEAEKMARELVAVTRHIPVEEVTVEVTVEHIDDVAVSQIVAEVAAERAQAAQLEADAASKAVALARTLSSRGISLRDIGAIIGVSHQRAHQLVHA
jgi:ribosomal protein L12E/L44/L45/RPP1/RPP2